MRREVEQFYASQGKHISKVVREGLRLYKKRGITEIAIKAAADRVYEEHLKSPIKSSRLAWRTWQEALDIVSDKDTESHIKAYEEERNITPPEVVQQLYDLRTYKERNETAKIRWHIFYWFLMFLLLMLYFSPYWEGIKWSF